MTVSRGDAVIALFPNADGSGSKPRPALVVQADAYNTRLSNVVVVAVTTNLSHATDPSSLLIDVGTSDGKASGLRRNSVVSCVNVATINSGLIAKKIGRLGPALMQRIDACLRTALGLP
jgi:mRNA-degrading endonuclease toxin of MazEF toxin-antitoxin module